MCLWAWSGSSASDKAGSDVVPGRQWFSKSWDSSDKLNYVDGDVNDVTDACATNLGGGEGENDVGEISGKGGVMQISHLLNGHQIEITFWNVDLPPF